MQLKGNASGVPVNALSLSLSLSLALSCGALHQGGRMALDAMVSTLSLDLPGSTVALWSVAAGLAGDALAVVPRCMRYTWLASSFPPFLFFELSGVNLTLSDGASA